MGSVAELIRRNGTDASIRQRPFLLFDDAHLTHADYYRECCRWAQLLLARRPPDGPFHVGVLLDNVPEYLLALGGAALAGAVLVGINNTQRGEPLARDIAHSDCAFVVTDAAGLELLSPVRQQLTRVPASRLLLVRATAETRAAAVGVADVAEDALGADVDPRLTLEEDAPLCLVFTSGTTGAPKAVVISHKRMRSTGEYVGGLMRVGPNGGRRRCWPRRPVARRCASRTAWRSTRSPATSTLRTAARRTHEPSIKWSPQPETRRDAS